MRLSIRTPGAAVRSADTVGRLRDGTSVATRPLVEADRETLVAAFGRLSSRSRYSRFLRSVSDEAFERMLPVLIDGVDQRSHIAVVLHAQEVPIGLGRVVRSSTDPAVADLAVTVVDGWQGRGAGALLAREVLAAAPGVREIRTVVGADNHASLRMLAGLGEVRAECAGGSCDVVVLLDEVATDAAA